VVIPVGGAGASLISIALMGQQPSRGQAPRSKMQLINPCGRAALGAEEPGEPLAEQLLANRLKLCHVLRPGLGRFKVQSRQPIGSAAIGEPELELPEVVVVGDGLCGRQSAFCKQAIPLGERGGPLVSEIQPAHDLARAASDRR
jgi:hypothetical protein